MHQKILFIYTFWPTSSPINKLTPSYSISYHTSPAHVHMHIVCFRFVCLFVCLFFTVVFVLYYSCCI